jgi:hypothetical protein
MARIYVASSWRNPFQPEIVTGLRARNHAVYDFRNPEGRTGFSWKQVGGPQDRQPTLAEYREMLAHPVAAAGYLSDFRAMEWADTCVLVLPCGRSAHLEAGWFAGRGKRLIILTRDHEEPELMALMANHICGSFGEVVEALAESAAA